MLILTVLVIAVLTTWALFTLANLIGRGPRWLRVSTRSVLYWLMIFGAVTFIGALAT